MQARSPHPHPEKRPLGLAKLVTTEPYLHLSDDDLANADARALREAP